MCRDGTGSGLVKPGPEPDRTCSGFWWPVSKPEPDRVAIQILAFRLIVYDNNLAGTTLQNISVKPCAETTDFKSNKNYIFRSGSNPVWSGLGPVLVRFGFREVKTRTRTGPIPSQNMCSTASTSCSSLRSIQASAANGTWRSS